MRLSFSAISTYKSCPRKYQLHYIDRIRPLQKGSPLSFGGAIDSASEFYLLNLEDICKRQKALAVFDQEMRKEHEENDIKYSQADIQLELIEADEILAQYEYDIKPEEFVKYCKENVNKLDASETEALKALQIEAIVAKGKLLLPLFFDWADENVKIVHSCQRKISLTNELGDEFIGYLDFDITLKNDKRYTYDMKTSSDPKRHYPEDSASKSPQLGIYSEAVGNRYTGYFVLDKKIRKREPRVRAHDIRGEVSEELLDEVFDDIETTRLAIKSGEFPKNTDSCWEYGKCWAYDLCKKGSMKGLCKKE